MILSGAPQYPTNVRPPATIAWRVWIAVTIGVRVMNAVRHYPLNRPALKGERAANRKKVFNWF